MESAVFMSSQWTQGREPLPQLLASPELTLGLLALHQQV